MRTTASSPRTVTSATCPRTPARASSGSTSTTTSPPSTWSAPIARKRVDDIAKAARGSDLVYLATDLDREGEAIAWHVAEAANVPESKTRRVTFSEITEPAIREAFANPRDIDQNLVDAQQARRIIDRLVGYTLSPLLSRKVMGGLSAGRVQSVAVRLVVEREREIDAFTAREYWTIETILATPAGDTFAAELVRIDGEALAIADEATADRPRRRRSATPSPVVARSACAPRSARPAPPFTTSTLQQEASRKLWFSPKRTMSIAQRLYEGVDTPDGHVGLITYMRTDSTAIAGVAMGEAREVIARALRRAVHDAQGPASTRPSPRAPRRPTSRSGRRRSSATRTRSRRMLKPEELRLYRLIWQRALASQMAPKELETTSVELADGRYELRASATKTLFDGFARVYTEGRDDEAEDDDESAQLPALAEGDATDRPRRHPDPALHRAAAALHRGDPDQGARGARHRPPVDLRRDDLDHRRPRLRPDRGAPAAPEPVAGHRHRPARRALRRLRRPRVHGAHGGGARRGRPRRARVGAAAPGVLPAAARPGRRGPQDDASSRLHDRGDRRGLLARATRWSSGSGATAGSWPARMYPEHKESRPLPGDEPPPLEGDGRDLPAVRRGHARRASAAGSARSSAARATPTATTSRRTARRRPDPLPFEVSCPKNRDGHARAASRAAHRERLLRVLQLPEVRLHDQPRAARRDPRRRRRPARAQGRGGDLPRVRLDQRHGTGRHRAGRALRRWSRRIRARWRGPRGRRPSAGRGGRGRGGRGKATGGPQPAEPAPEA